MHSYGQYKERLRETYAPHKIHIWRMKGKSRQEQFFTRRKNNLKQIIQLCILNYSPIYHLFQRLESMTHVQCVRVRYTRK